MLTKAVFFGIVAAVFLQRLSELRISQRHIAYLLTQGGREHGSNYLWVVKVLQLSWFVAMIEEVWWLERHFVHVFADQPRFIPRKQGVKIAIQMKRFTIAKAIAALIVPAPIAMCQMISGFWVSRAIYIVAKLGIADYLHKQPKTADELAAITNTH